MVAPQLAPYLNNTYRDMSSEILFTSQLLLASHVFRSILKLRDEWDQIPS